MRQNCGLREALLGLVGGVLERRVPRNWQPTTSDVTMTQIQATVYNAASDMVCVGKDAAPLSLS